MYEAVIKNNNFEIKVVYEIFNVDKEVENGYKIVFKMSPISSEALEIHRVYMDAKYVYNHTSIVDMRLDQIKELCKNLPTIWESFIECIPHTLPSFDLSACSYMLGKDGLTLSNYQRRSY